MIFITQWPVLRLVLVSPLLVSHSVMAENYTPGIDVSHYQGMIRWDQVNDEQVRFAYAQATAWTVYVDPQFLNNWYGMKQAGLLQGAYHYFYANAAVDAQAQHFLDVVGPHIQPDDLPPMLDVEDTYGASSQQVIAAVKTWLTTVEQALGCKPVIYTDLNFANTHDFGMHFSDYPLWVAEYNSAPMPQLPTGFSNWMFWQYSSSGAVDGVTGRVDLDRFNGSYAQLAAFAKNSPCELKPKPVEKTLCTP